MKSLIYQNNQKQNFIKIAFCTTFQPTLLTANSLKIRLFQQTEASLNFIHKNLSAH